MIATRAPSRAKRLAIARPMPRLPPDINTTLPASGESFIARTLFDRRFGQELRFAQNGRSDSGTFGLSEAIRCISP